MNQPVNFYWIKQVQDIKDKEQQRQELHDLLLNHQRSEAATHVFERSRPTAPKYSLINRWSRT